LKATKAERNSLIERLRDLEVQNQELETSCQQTKSQLEGAAVVHKETVADLDAVRKALHQKESSKDRSEKVKLCREIQSQKVEISRLQKTIASQESEIHELVIAKNESERLLNTQTSKLSELKQAVQKREQRIEQLEIDLAQSDQELKSRLPVAIDDFLPQNTWLSSEFESEINSQIAKIVANPALQPPSRLQHIYHMIHNYYTNLLKSREQALDQSFQENQSIASTVNSFLISLSIAIGLQPITFSDFLADQSAKKIVNIVAGLKMEQGDLRRANEQLNSVIAHFYETFQIPQNDDLSRVIQQITGIGEKLVKQNEALQKRTRKAHDLNHSMKSLTKQYESEMEDLQFQIASLNNNIESLRHNNEDLSTTNLDLRKQLQNAQSDIREFQQGFEENQVQLRESYEARLQETEQSRDFLDTQLRSELAEEQRKSTEITEALASQTETVRVLKQVIASQKAALAERSTDLSAIQGEVEEQQQLLSKRLDLEKKRLIDEHERIIADFRARCEKQREDIEKLTGELVEVEKRFKAGKTKVFELKKINLRQEKDIEAQTRQIEREQKLREASTRAAVLNAEATYEAKLDDYRSQWETEKRRILVFIADTFKQHFSPQDPIDERTIKQVVSKAKKELTTLNEANTAVRKIVGAQPYQKTADAVAQAMIDRE
jgi:chromosome segregation ATPase